MKNYIELEPATLEHIEIQDIGAIEGANLGLGSIVLVIATSLAGYAMRQSIDAIADSWKNRGKQERDDKIHDALVQDREADRQSYCDRIAYLEEQNSLLLAQVFASHSK